MCCLAYWCCTTWGTLSLDSQWFGSGRILATECCRYDWVQVVHIESVFSQQLRSSSCVSLLVPCAKVLSDKRSVAIWKVAVINLLRVVYAGQPIVQVALSQAMCKKMVWTHDSVDGGKDAQHASNSCHSLHVGTRTSCRDLSGFSSSFCCHQLHHHRHPHRPLHFCRAGDLASRHCQAKRVWAAQPRQRLCPSCPGIEFGSCPTQTRALHAWRGFGPSLPRRAVRCRVS